MLKAPDSKIKGQLVVGETLLSPVGFGVGVTKLPGTAYISGPIMVGDTKSFVSPPGVPLASGAMITKRSSLDGLVGSAGLELARAFGLVPSPSIMIVSNSIEQPIPLPTDVLIGTPILPVGVTVNTGISFFTVMSTSSNFFSLTNIGMFAPLTQEIAALSKKIGQKIFVGARAETAVTTNTGAKFQCGVKANCATGVEVDSRGALSTINTLQVTKKGFDIPHPTKEEHRLRYICIEGPSADVYVRGKLKDSNTIELPDYWKGLVDPETIDVSLTPMGSFQELFVESIQWGTRVIVKNAAGGPVNCSYIIYGERKDSAKNIPEYKGLTPQDYPGDNKEYVINGIPQSE